MRRLRWVMVVVVFGAGLATTAASAPVGADPADFVDESRVTGLERAVAGAWHDDGRLIILGTAGHLWISTPSSGAKTQLGIVPSVDTSLGRGATGIVTDPNFATNRRFYVYYTHDASDRLRVDRFTYSDTGATMMASQTMIWQSPGVMGTLKNHFGGGMVFGTDGYLYLSIGEGDTGSNSTDLTNPFGKVLRFDTSGTAAPDNPFVDVVGALDHIWAYGLRNPFRMTLGDHGDLLIADVGGAVRATAHEEIDLGIAGADYGWPSCEGPVAGNTCRAGTIGPIFGYNHSNGAGGFVAHSITGGEVFHSDALPSWLDGAYIYGEFMRTEMRYVRFDPDHQTLSSGLVRSVGGNPTWVSEGPDGHIYYITYNSSGTLSQLRRLRYSGAIDHAPVITTATAAPSTGSAPVVVQFTGAATDADGDPISYLWTFGDGTTSAAASPAHTYDDAGTYTARLRATSDGTSVFSDAITIEVGPAASGDVYTALESCVVGDSTSFGPLAGGSVTAFDVTGAVVAGQGAESTNCGVPAGANAVLVEIAAVDPSGSGNLLASASGTAPTGGVVNFANTTPRLDNSNAVVIPLSSAGSIDIGVNCGPGCTAPTTDVRLTILGYFDDPTGASDEWAYVPVNPCAAFDSRSNQGATGPSAGRYDAGEQRLFTLIGTLPAGQGGGNTSCGVPAGADAVMINLVAVNSSVGGKVAIGAGGSDPDEPVVGHSPLSPAMNNANAVVVPLDASGRLVVEAQGAPGQVDMVDIRGVVVGYLQPAAGLAGGRYHAVTPCAAFDSRSNQGAGGSFAGPLVHETVRSFTVAGSFPATQGGGATDCGVPLGAAAVLVNLVAVNPLTPGNLRVSAAGETAAGGLLNFAPLSPAMNNSNAVVVPLSGSGRIDVVANTGAAVGQQATDVRGVILGYLTGD